MRSLVLAVLLVACSDPAPVAPPSHATASPSSTTEPARSPSSSPSSDAPSNPRSSLPPVDERPEWLEALRDESQWLLLAAPSNEHAVARTEVVKLLWDHTTDRLYFCQSTRWPIHYDFAVRHLQTEARPLGDRRSFNRRQYLHPDRELQMATLVRYRDADLFALELGPADNLDPDGLVALLDRLRPALYFADRLHYRPRSAAQEERVAPVRERVRAIAPDAVWRGVRYQPITLGTAVGRLRFVRGALDPATVLPDQILVLDHVPEDIPLCAGIVTAQLQAPLAHVAVLSQSRGTPNMALRDVEQSPLRALDQRIVRLEVRADDYRVTPATDAELERALAASRPPPVAPPALDASRTTLVDTCALRMTDASWAGAKAAQLGEVCGAGVLTSEGFVVPIAHFVAHLRAHGIDASSAALRARPGFADDGRARGSALEALRARIVEAPIDTELVGAVRARMRSARGRRWIFRSSTNAEDLPGFSGAGLYDSVVTEADPDDAAIARALREVWASVWSRRAWDEREWYRVDHDAVAMAVLVQPFVDDVIAMGVAITENPFSTQRSGILVNLAPPGASVTAAGGEELPEQILLYRHSQPEILSRSTRNGGRPLLTREATRPLRDRLDAVHAHMMARWGERADAADVELALRRDGEIVILQARPYRLRRSP